MLFVHSWVIPGDYVVKRCRGRFHFHRQDHHSPTNTKPPLTMPNKYGRH